VAHSTVLLGRLYRGQPVRRAVEVCLAGVALMLLGYAHAPADQTQPISDRRLPAHLRGRHLGKTRHNRGDLDAAYIWARA
jgi:hypothetical protein